MLRVAARADSGADDLAFVCIALSDDGMPVVGGIGAPNQVRRLALEVRELGLQSQDAIARQRKRLLESEGVGLGVLRLEDEVPEVPGVVVTGPLPEDLEPALREHPSSEDREQLVVLVVARRVLRRGEHLLADALEDREVVAQRDSVVRDQDVEYARRAERQPRQEAG